MVRIPAVLLVLAAVAGGCGHRTSNQSADALKSGNSNIRTALVRLGNVPITVSAFGTIAGGANAQASLAFPEAGRIAHIDVVIGQHVDAGQVLAQLDTAPFDAAVAQAQANVEAAQANYVKTAAGARPQQRAQTTAQIEQARTQLSVAQSQLKRKQTLFEAGVASQADVEAAKSTFASAEAQLRVLEEQQSSEIHPLAQDVESARAQLAQANAALRAAQQARTYATLTAPFSGVIIARMHSAGEAVDATTSVIQLAAGEAPTFTAQFDPHNALRIHTGDSATVSFADSGAQTSGTVIAINAAQTAEGRQLPVLIRLRSQPAGAGPGAYGQVSIRVGSANGLVVPDSALVQDPTTGSTLVFRKSGDHYNPIPVKINGSIGQESWVTSDQLHPNDAIVVSGAAELMTAPQSSEGND